MRRVYHKIKSSSMGENLHTVRSFYRNGVLFEAESRLGGTDKIQVIMTADLLRKMFREDFILTVRKARTWWHVVDVQLATEGGDGKRETN